MDQFTHFSEKDASARMVDVGDKKITLRTARASGEVVMLPQTLDRIRDRLLPKGDVFEVARIAGIQAAKRTADLIPLCHPLLPVYIDVVIELDGNLPGVRITSEIRLEGRTGAEMEALTAVAVAGLTVYDMCKAVDKEMVIGNITLVEKTGGKSDYRKKTP